MQYKIERYLFLYMGYLAVFRLIYNFFASMYEKYTFLFFYINKPDINQRINFCLVSILRLRHGCAPAVDNNKSEVTDESD